MNRLIFAILVLLSSIYFCPLFAAERVALVIGNNSYVHGTPLKNCVNDARAVTKALEGVGFEVISGEDASLQEFEAKVLEFRRKAQGAKAAWFHYSGHGVEVAGTNYLVPVDANVEEEFQVKHKTYPLDQILGAMEGAKAPLKVVVLDCCRDNPFGRGWSRSGASGLAQVADTPDGTIIAFATSPGKVAADGAGANSPFTSALVSSLRKPGLEIEQVFIETGRLVKETTGNRQIPWRNSSFYGSFILMNGGTDGVIPSPMLPDSPAPLAEVSPLDRGEVGKPVELKLLGEVPVLFQYCPPGSFTMGSPKTEEGRGFDENQVSVRITKGFWMARTECTQVQWKAVMGSDPSEFKGDDLPVESVSWDDVQEFIGKLNRAGGLPEGWQWSLPTEAQWEYACRAGTTTIFSFGNSLTLRQANFGEAIRNGGAGKGASLEKTSRVGSYTANTWGLYDMHGNVWEWCSDWHAEGLGGGADPKGPLSDVLRVLRGGAWNDGAVYCRAANRSMADAGGRSHYLGFRPALVPSR